MNRILRAYFCVDPLFAISIHREAGFKGDHRILKTNRLTLDYVFLNKYTIEMKLTNFF